MRRSTRTRVAVVAVAMALAAGLGLMSLAAHPFWDDEANTALYARNLLQLGRLTAWDGRNLVGYAYGGALGPDLGRELRVPPLPAWLAAAGMRLCGQGTFGGRLPFVIVGVAGVGLLALWMRRHLGRRFAWWLPPLILALSPAYLLYVRNCRYYALSVVGSLLVWICWAPGRSRADVGRADVGRISNPLTQPGTDWKSVLQEWVRHGGWAAAAVAAMLLLWTTHYLGAAAVLATLPVFFLERRYRRPRQYVLLAVLLAASGLYGGWVLRTANPFAAEYRTPADAMFFQGSESDQATRFTTHLGWLLRDLGTHEFFPWCLVLVLAIPLAAEVIHHRGQYPLWFLPLRSLAWRGCVLVLVVLVYVLVAAALTPADMAKGPLAEMRYVVPLLAVGAALGGLALVILYHLWRPLGPLFFLLLVGSNVLHLGFLLPRSDGTARCWPPTLYRYVREQLSGHQTGNAALLAMLAQLPSETTVRVWPSYMAYPPMFYVPGLCYCDQLTERKAIAPELRAQLPDYLYVERARPAVMLVPAPFLRQALDDLAARWGREAYRPTRTLSPYWNYTSKPEIPAHFFSAPPPDWRQFPGMAVLVDAASPVAGHAALRTDAKDAVANYQMGMTLGGAGMLKEASTYYAAALRQNPDYAETYMALGENLAQIRLVDHATVLYSVVLRSAPERLAQYVDNGHLLTQQGTPLLAVPYYRAALLCEPDHVSARVGLGVALARLGGLDMAVRQYRRALRIDPKLLSARVYLAEALLASDRAEEAMAEYREALRLAPADSELGRQLERVIKQLEHEKSSPDLYRVLPGR